MPMAAAAETADALQSRQFPPISFHAGPKNKRHDWKRAHRPEATYLRHENLTADRISLHFKFNVGPWELLSRRAFFASCNSQWPRTSSLTRTLRDRRVVSSIDLYALSGAKSNFPISCGLLGLKSSLLPRSSIANGAARPATIV